MRFHHEGIPVGFGQDTGRCDAAKTPIPSDFAAMGHLPPGLESVTVHQNQLRDQVELFQGPMHRPNTGLQDVHLIDFGRAANPHRPS